MKKVILLLCFAIALSAAAENLIKNGDFSEGLKFWYATNKTTHISQSVTCNGKKALCMEGASEFIQLVELEPDTDYILTYSIKGENIVPTAPRNSGACIVFKGGNRWWRSTPAADNRMTGTFDWKRHTYKFNSSFYQNKPLSIRLTLNANGKCYFADMQLVKASPEAKPAAAPAAAPAEIKSSNLLVNGDFTNGLQGWHVDNKAVAIDPAAKAGDKNAVCLPSNSRIQQSVALEPDTMYEFSFLIKGENIVGTRPFNSGACVVLNSGKIYNRQTPTGDNRRMTGTFDWKRHTFKFNSSKDFNGKRLSVRLEINANGKCYFADVKLVKIGKAPAKTEVKTSTNRYFRESLLKDYPVPVFFPLGESYGFAEPGKPVKFQLDLQAMPDLEYSITVNNDLGEKVFEIPRKAYKDRTFIEIPGQIRGYYVAEVSVFIKDKLIARTQAAFVSVPLMAKRDPFFQINQFGLVPYMIEGYRHLGAGSVVLPLGWNTPGDIKANVQQRFVHYYKGILESDFDVYLMAVGGVTQHNANLENFKKGYPLCTPEHFKMLEDYAREAAKVLKGKVKGYGSIMEIASAATIKHKHSGTWVEAMSQQLFISRIFARAVRSVDPTAKISAGGNNIQMYTNSIEKLVMTDLVDDFDIYNIDAYFGNWNLTNGNPSIPEKSLRSFYLESSRLAQSLGKTPLVQNTETGYAI